MEGLIKSMNAQQRKATIENWALVDPLVNAVMTMADRDSLPWQNTVELLVLHLAAAKAELETIAAQALARARPETVVLPLAPRANVRSA